MAFLSTKRMVSLAAAAALALAPGAQAAPALEDAVVVRAGTVITGTGDPIRGGEIIIIDGKIELVGRGLEYPPGAEIIDAQRMTVMAGMIHPMTRAGLRSYTRRGINGNRTASEEIGVDPFDTDRFLEAGFTTIGVLPAGSGVPGYVSAYRVAGPEDERVIETEAMLPVDMRSMPRDKTALRGAFAKAKKELEAIEKARKEFEKKQEEAKKKAEAEAKKKQAEAEQAKKDGKPAPQPPKQEQKKPEPPKFQPPRTDPTHEPFRKMLKGEDAPMVLRLSRSANALHAFEVLDRVTEDNEDAKLTVSYMLPTSFFADWSYAIDQFAEREARVVMTAQMGRMPQTTIRYNQAAEFASRGATLCLTPAGDSEFWLQRARTDVSDLIRHGLDEDTALAAMTVNNAALLGLDKRLGTIEKGKDADLVFLDGDPFSGFSKVQKVMVLGEIAWDRDEENDR